MNILLTGSTGFIGKALYKRLSEDYNVIGLSRGVCQEQNHISCDLVKVDVSELQSIIQNNNIQHVLHFAADPLVKNGDYKATESHVLATHKLLDACNNSIGFYFASSATVYGKYRIQKRSLDKPNPQSVYGLSKFYCEKLIDLYVRQEKIRQAGCFRLCAQVGGNSTHGLLHDIVKKLKSDDKFLYLIGNRPGSKKPYMHINSTVDFIYNALRYTASLSKELYFVTHISTQDNITVLQVAKLAMDVLGIYKPIKWLGKEANWFGDDNFVKLFSSYDGNSHDEIIKALNEYKEIL